MLKSTFLHKLKQDRVLCIDDYSISYKPAEISSCDTEERYRFKNIDDLYENGMLGSERLKDKLTGADMAIFHKDYGEIITIDMAASCSLLMAIMTRWTNRRLELCGWKYTRMQGMRNIYIL